MSAETRPTHLQSPSPAEAPTCSTGPRWISPRPWIYIGNEKEAGMSSQVTKIEDSDGGAITDHKIGTREEWLAAREQLLVREKEHTRLGDQIAQQRRELPRVAVEKDYRFDTDDGEKALVEL